MDRQQFLQQIGDRIIDQRHKIDMSQEELSLESELDRSYIGKVERGEINISVINLFRIADALSVCPTCLIETLDINEYLKFL